MRVRCQVCGRRQGLKKTGGVRFHHVAGVPCEGAGFPPLEVDDGRLAQLAAEAWASYRKACDEVRALEERRANWIDPRLTARLYADLAKWSRLTRRLDRHRAWPDRFRRQMDRQGYGLPPPAYLVERENTINSAEPKYPFAAPGALD
jgi:hypothetical protein